MLIGSLISDVLDAHFILCPAVTSCLCAAKAARTPPFSAAGKFGEVEAVPQLGRDLVEFFWRDFEVTMRLLKAQFAPESVAFDGLWQMARQLRGLM